MEDKAPAYLQVFWRRFGAVAVDFLLWAVIGFLLVKVLGNLPVRLGIWSRLIGLPFHLGYFTLMDSGVANGQTLGKRIFGIRVVDTNGRSITIKQSFLRTLIFLTSYYGNGWFLISGTMSAASNVEINIILGFIFIAIMPAEIYFILFNRRTGQGFHDLLVKSYVVRANVGTENLKFPPIWKRHYAIAAGFIIATLAVFGFFLLNPKFNNLYEAQKAMNQLPSVAYSTMMQGKTHSVTTGFTTEYLDAFVYVDGKEPVSGSLAQQAAEAVMRAVPTDDSEQIRVSIVYKIDIGLYQFNRGRVFVHTRAEWAAQPIK